MKSSLADMVEEEWNQVLGKNMFFCTGRLVFVYVNPFHGVRDFYDDPRNSGQRS